MASLSYAARAHRYARDVVSGKRVECEWIRLACERHLAEVERKDWGWYFDADQANRYCYFIEGLPHVKGRWRTRTINLEDWQIFFIASVFGWLDRATRYRRFRKALLVVARGNSKTTLAAACALAVLCLDHEPGAQLYSAAKTRDQAKICWLDAKSMVSRTGGLKRTFGVDGTAHAITLLREASSFQPISRDADVSEGLSVHLAIIDEVHAHPDRKVYDVMLHGMRARKQPLLIEISTEGEDKSGILGEEIDYLKDILRGSIEGGERFFGLYYTLDKEDDWTHPAAWKKANPNLEVSVFPDELAVLRDQALANPGAQASFKMKRCNLKIGSIESYFNLFAWDNLCAVPDLLEADFFGCPCWFGVDLASESDIAAVMRLYRRGNVHAVFGSYFLPEDCIGALAVNRDRYRGWATGKRPWLTLTQGNSTDFDVIEHEILDLAALSNPREIAFDKYQATQMMGHLQTAGLVCFSVHQSASHLSEPMKLVAAAIQSGKLKHNGDPILSWAIGNVIAKTNEREEVVPRKAQPAKKIDPASGLLNAMSRAIASPYVVQPYASAADSLV